MVAIAGLHEALRQPSTLLGLAYALNGNLAKALGVLNTGIEQSPNDARLYATRAFVRAKVHDAAARDDAKRAIALDPRYQNIVSPTLVHE